MSRLGVVSRAGFKSEEARTRRRSAASLSEFISNRANLPHLDIRRQSIASGSRRFRLETHSLRQATIIRITDDDLRAFLESTKAERVG